MLDIGWSEMFVILVVALIVIGPRDLPKVARTLGKWVGKGRALAREFQTSIEDMAREAELDEVKKEIERAGRRDFGKSIEKTIDPRGELRAAFDPQDNGRTTPAKPARKAAATNSGAEVAGPPPPTETPADEAKDQADAEPKRVAAGSP